MNMSLSRIVKAAPLRRTTLAMALGALGAAPAAYADWNNQSIIKAGERQHGIHIKQSDGAGVRTATGTTIKVSGRQAQGVLLENPAAELRFQNGSVTSSGQLFDEGVRRFLGTVTVKAGKLVADHATLANVSDTRDDDGIALYVAGEQAQASIADSTLQGAGGVRVERGANVTVQRSTIVDGGLHIGTLQPLQPEDLPPSRVVLGDTSVTAVPASGAPAAVFVFGANELTVDGGHITGGGQRGWRPWTGRSCICSARRYGGGTRLPAVRFQAVRFPAVPFPAASAPSLTAGMAWMYRTPPWTSLSRSSRRRSWAPRSGRAAAPG
ncbi:pertactin precursor [Bordetella parapertussis]|nr:pertactin precursor [Bordetella parapertussis]